MVTRPQSAGAKIISLATVKRQAKAAMVITKRNADLARRGIMRRSAVMSTKDDPEIASYRKLLRAHIGRLEKRALAGPLDDPDRIDAVKGLSAMVLCMYVAEHDLRLDVHRAIAAMPA